MANVLSSLKNSNNIELIDDLLVHSLDSDDFELPVGSELLGAYHGNSWVFLRNHEIFVVRDRFANGMFRHTDSHRYEYQLFTSKQRLSSSFISQTLNIVKAS